MPMTRQEIRYSVRDKTGSWPKIVTTLNGAITSTATTITLTDSGTDLSPQDLIEIDSETMLVKSVVSATSITVARGFHGTTKASHSSGVDVNGYASYGWTDNQVNKAIARACEWSATDPNPLWSFKFYSGTWPIDTYEVDISNSIANWPNKGGYILRVEFQTDESPTRWERITNFEQRKSIIRLGVLFSEARTFRIHLADFQPALASDASQLDNVAFETAIILYSCYWLLKDLQGSRPKFVEYSAALNDRASTMDELLRVVFDFKNQASLEKRDASQPIPKELRRFFYGRRI